MLTDFTGPGAPRSTIASVRRVLFAANTLIALIALAAAATFYWFFYRALPAASGSIAAYVSQPVRVDRDRLGVPHIHAKTIDDAWFVQGYTTAEDRMFQMDGLRRLAAGELSEIVGTGALESDRESRRMRMRRTAEQIYAQMPAPDKAAMAAYARGVNAYIESHHGRYGFEFALLGYDPRPWTVVDSLLAGLQMFRTLTNDWQSKLVKQRMLAAGEPDKVNFLFPYRSGFELPPGADEHPGSNAWAIAGSRSATGKPLLSNDMHLEYSVPGVWYLDHLEAPGLNVTRRRPSRRPRHPLRTQRPHRLGTHQSRLRRPGSLHREDGPPYRPLSLPGQPGTGLTPNANSSPSRTTPPKNSRPG